MELTTGQGNNGEIGYKEGEFGSLKPNFFILKGTVYTIRALYNEGNDLVMHVTPELPAELFSSSLELIKK